MVFEVRQEGVICQSGTGTNGSPTYNGFNTEEEWQEDSAMKKYLILMLAAAAALVSCGKEILVPETDVPENINETVQATPITFNLSANHPEATKAVKEDWQDGDAIFVFFSGAAAPKHLKMTFDGTSWTSPA